MHLVFAEADLALRARVADGKPIEESPMRPLVRPVSALLIALVGLGIITTGLFLMVEKLGIHYLTARIAIALIAGVWNFSMNVLVNFRDVRDKKR